MADTDALVKRKRLSADERLRKNRERNKSHAKRARERKKNHMEALKIRIRDLEEESVELRARVDTRYTANVLLGLGTSHNTGHNLTKNGELAIRSSTSVCRDLDKLTECHRQEILLQQQQIEDDQNSLLQRCTLQQEIRNKIELQMATAAAKQNDIYSVQLNHVEDTVLGSNSTTDISLDNMSSKSSGSGRRGKYTPKERESIRRERNRIHAKKTRDKKKIFLESSEKIILSLEADVTTLREYLLQFNLITMKEVERLGEQDRMANLELAALKESSSFDPNVARAMSSGGIGSNAIGGTGTTSPSVGGYGSGTQSPMDSRMSITNSPFEASPPLTSNMNNISPDRSMSYSNSNMNSTSNMPSGMSMFNANPNPNRAHMSAFSSYSNTNSNTTSCHGLTLESLAHISTQHGATYTSARGSGTGSTSGNTVVSMSDLSNNGSASVNVSGNSVGPNSSGDSGSNSNQGSKDASINGDTASIDNNPYDHTDTGYGDMEDNDASTTSSSNNSMLYHTVETLTSNHSTSGRANRVRVSSSRASPAYSRNLSNNSSNSASSQNMLLLAEVEAELLSSSGMTSGKKRTRSHTDLSHISTIHSNSTSNSHYYDHVDMTIPLVSTSASSSGSGSTSGNNGNISNSTGNDSTITSGSDNGDTHTQYTETQYPHYNTSREDIALEEPLHTHAQTIVSLALLSKTSAQASLASLGTINTINTIANVSGNVSVNGVTKRAKPQHTL